MCIRDSSNALTTDASLAPTISAITPTVVKVQGGETITITGTNDVPVIVMVSPPSTLTTVGVMALIVGAKEASVVRALLMDVDSPSTFIWRIKIH